VFDGRDVEVRAATSFKASVSIHFLTGNPGGGKGLLAMQKIVDELTHDERPILTNLPVRVEPWVRRWSRFGKTHWKPEIGLRNYLLKKYGRDFDVGKRVFYIADELVPEFYLWRRNGDGLFQLKAERDSTGRVEEFETQKAVENGGVCYVTDECWRFWNSRKWQRTGDGLLFYSAQHRHLGDTWYVVTQKTAQVDKALHRVAQDFSVVTNQGKLPLGGFSRPDVFTVCVYDEAPTGSKLEPIKRDVFTLDKKGLGACYDTAAGTGIGGGSGADLNERKKGLPWWVGVLALIAVAVLLLKSPSLVKWFVASRFKKDAAVVTQKLNTEIQPGAQIRPDRGIEFSEMPTNSTNFGIDGDDRMTQKLNSRPVVTGRFVFRGVMYVLLSDGRSIASPRASMCNAEFAIIDGERYEWHRGPPVGSYVREVPPVELPPVYESRAQSTLIVIGQKPQARKPAAIPYPDSSLSY